MRLPTVYSLVARHNKFLRGASGIGALVVILWGLGGEAVYRKVFPYPPIQTVEKSFVSNAKVGGKIVYHAEGVRRRTGCSALIQGVLTDSTGARLYMPAVEGGNEPAGPYQIAVPGTTPTEASPGPAILEITITFSHAHKKACNEILRQRGELTIYPADHMADPTLELNRLSVDVSSVPY